MSNDNKTLADVRPGGRVRLGDGLAIESRARELLAHEYAMSGSTKRADKIIAGFDCAPATEYAVRAIVAALSAQPSPGGQGDSRSEKAATFLRQYLTYLRSSPRQGLRPRWCDVYEALEVAIEALAARQPVGEPVCFINGEHLAECQIMPMVESVDEPGKMVPRNIAGSNMRDEYHDTALYLQPAQAVDLGAVRALLQRRIAQWRSHLPADPGAPGTREIETKGEHDYNNDVRIYREGIAVMEEVLALTDSQAVGNG